MMKIMVFLFVFLVIHHLSGDPYIVATILKVKGQEWNNSLQEKRKERVKFNKAYMKGIIEKLQ